jgi:hypothetical protein
VRASRRGGGDADHGRHHRLRPGLRRRWAWPNRWGWRRITSCTSRCATPNRQAGLAERLGPRFDASLYGLAADGIINETLLLAGHGLPRPAVTLTDLLEEIGRPAKSPVEALADWDADRLAMLLHSDARLAEKARDWGVTRGFAQDLSLGEPDDTGERQKTADWRNQLLRALEAGRKAGTGVGRLGAILADMAPAETAWEVVLRGILARALTDRPRVSHRARRAPGSP